METEATPAGSTRSEPGPPLPAVTTLTLAAVQASAPFLSRSASTAKTISLILEAGRRGVDVMAFPESFIPSYPGWVECLPLTREPSRTLYTTLFDQAVEIPGPETAAIGEACRTAGVFAVVGVTERRRGTTGTLWNTAVTFGRDGRVLMRHQKYVPTVGERLVHAPGTTGSKASLSAAELHGEADHLEGGQEQDGKGRTERNEKKEEGLAGGVGGLSALLCAENGNPLAVYAAGLSYPLVHCALWPPHWAPGQEMQGGILTITKAIAFSLGCFVINSVGVVNDAAVEAYGLDEEGRKFLREEQRKRRATILAPLGEVIASGGEGEDDEKGELVVATVDVGRCVGAKYGMDYVGHYNRPEVFAHLFQGL